MGGRGGSRSFVAVFQGLFGTSHPKNCALSLLTVSDTDLGLDSGFEHPPTKSWSQGGWVSPVLGPALGPEELAALK